MQVAEEEDYVEAISHVSDKRGESSSTSRRRPGRARRYHRPRTASHSARLDTRMKAARTYSHCRCHAEYVVPIVRIMIAATPRAKAPSKISKNLSRLSG